MIDKGRKGTVENREESEKERDDRKGKVTGCLTGKGKREGVRRGILGRKKGRYGRQEDA